MSACLPAERGDVYAGTFDLRDVRARAVGGERVVPAAGAASLPGLLVRDFAGISAALAAARAVLRSPGAADDVPRARYVRTSAAEEFHGVARP